MRIKLIDEKGEVLVVDKIITIVADGCLQPSGQGIKGDVVPFGRYKFSKRPDKLGKFRTILTT